MITLHNGNSAEVLKQYPDNHFDSVVTDPPYGIEFLGRDWDNNTGAIEVWQECLRVLKPGGYLLAFGAPRTYHRLATNLEDIGFEIKDSLMWLYGSGFPKAQDVGKRLDKKGIDNDFHGWKTALKPAHEPIIMCRKPTKLSTMDNMVKYGVGALNIDGSRVGDEKTITKITKITNTENGVNMTGKFGSHNDEYYNTERNKDKETTEVINVENAGRFPSNVIGEVEGYQKYFYHPKVSRKERDMGESNNVHPTIKPVALMKYLVTLITPPNGKVLDPFNGSGSTGMAVKEFGGEYVGIDLDENYIEISRKRINAYQQ